MMKLKLLYFVYPIVFLFSLCRYENERKRENKIVGHWKFLNLENINSVESEIKTDIMKLSGNNCISSSFDLTLENDNKYTLKSLKGNIYKGKYIHKNSMLELYFEEILFFKAKASILFCDTLLLDIAKAKFCDCEKDSLKIWYANNVILKFVRTSVSADL